MRETLNEKLRKVLGLSLVPSLLLLPPWRRSLPLFSAATSSPSLGVTTPASRRPSRPGCHQPQPDSPSACRRRPNLAIVLAGDPAAVGDHQACYIWYPEPSHDQLHGKYQRHHRSLGKHISRTISRSDPS